MGLAWNPWGLADLAALAATWTLAAIIYAVGPSRRQNRRLAGYLAILGALRGCLPIAYFATDAATIVAAYRLSLLPWLALFPAYLALLATVDSPLSRPLTGRAGDALIAGLALLVIPLYILERGPYIVAVVPAQLAAYGTFQVQVGPFYAVLATADIIIRTFSFVVALSAFRRAPKGSPARSRAAAYTWAFGILDTFWILALTMDVGGSAGVWAIPPMTSFLIYRAGGPIVTVLFVALLAYGILRSQLFDIDLKIKSGVRRGTLVGAFVAAFFVATAIAEQFLQQYGVLLGGAAVGLLLFALRPIERAADRLADRAMPRVQDTNEYRMVRKRVVYRAAIESALEEGDISSKERGMLATLQDQLGIGAKDAHDIEREAREARARVA